MCCIRLIQLKIKDNQDSQTLTVVTQLVKPSKATYALRESVRHNYKPLYSVTMPNCPTVKRYTHNYIHDHTGRIDLTAYNVAGWMCGITCMQRLTGDRRDQESLPARIMNAFGKLKENVCIANASALFHKYGAKNSSMTSHQKA